MSRDLAANPFLAEGGPREIAGYRVVRRLTAGRRSTVFLGYPVGRSDGDSVALRVFHHDVEMERVDVEIAVLLEAPAGISATVHDVVTVPDGSLCVVQERDDGLTLADLLHRRGSLRAGEAVTILAPIVVGLDRLHAVGWAHNAVGVGSVRFDRSGRPRLGRWAGARRLGEGKQRTHQLRDEYAALEALVSEVCKAIDPLSVVTHELEAMLEWLTEMVGVHPFVPAAAELEQRVFALARALPIRLPASDEAMQPSQEREAVQSGAGTELPSRSTRILGAQHRLATTSELHTEPNNDGTTDEPDRAPALVWRNSLFGSSLGAALTEAVEGSFMKRWCSLARTRLARITAQRRKPLIVAACVGGAALVLMITLVPPSRSAQGEPSDASGVSAEAAGPDPASSETAEKSIQADDSGRETDATATNVSDPVAAAGALLARRVECYRALSLLCIDEVSAPGSPLAEADGISIRRAQESGVIELPAELNTETMALVEQNGGAAMLSVSLVDGPAGEETAASTKPASLLMIRGEAGWRLRELFGS